MKRDKTEFNWIQITCEKTKEGRRNVGWKAQVKGLWYGDYIEIYNTQDDIQEAIKLICKQACMTIETVLNGES